MTTYTDRGARFSADGRYRYSLWREWGRKPKTCLFIMLNPSTAGEVEDDPTIRRCVGFARSWGYDRMEVVNLFAHRATDPKALLALNHDDDPVGWENQRWVERATNAADIIVCAWGAHGGHLGQAETMLGWLGERKLYHLGLTQEGHPRHPLYLAGSTKPQVWQ
jgi:hypothetical protein